MLGTRRVSRGLSRGVSIINTEGYYCAILVRLGDELSNLEQLQNQCNRFLLYFMCFLHLKILSVQFSTDQSMINKTTTTTIKVNCSKILMKNNENINVTIQSSYKSTLQENYCSPVLCETDVQWTVFKMTTSQCTSILGDLARGSQSGETKLIFRRAYFASISFVSPDELHLGSLQYKVQ